VNLMKSLRVALILTIITVVLLCNSSVAALNQDQATARVLFSSETLPAGQTATGVIFFSSTSSDPLEVTAVSIHFDWMPSGQVMGYQLTTPFTLESGGSHFFDSMQIRIPLNLDSGSHSYYVGIDGTENGVPFSWDSPLASVGVIGGLGNATTAPSSTNSGAEQPEGQPNLFLYGAIGAIVVIVVLLVVVFMLRVKRAGSKQAANQVTDQPKSSAPEKKPNPEQDFNI
jgi:F0F1-type ATP synthase membrane subunit c/vacuolar-type H+-ATPase subunit K